ncbi:cell wall-binding repeat-containing protein [Clostridium tyrobutyricum]|uniref:cell wall-binding repeat-containing protein n=1 Tax=Clostridium tyrobutyricum TaxID=1519 RepID=UPI001C38A490|nr:cell wall-binding repeat-containing protein [Clostridium tyrobutyricum]MBV4439902.1 cell wall-binding repeat-containing protein [Clostridium tyrobutyricum]
MNKKGTKALASATLMSLVLTTALATGNVKAAANGQATRVGGTDRYETAAKVATTNFTTSDNVVLVSGEGYADSVSASVLAKKLDAPIVLTGSQTLDANAKSAIETLKAKNVYIIGGTGSISASIESGLKSNYTVTRLGGKDRYATNLAIANKLVDLGVSKDNIIAVAGTGFADALSVAPVAAADNEILLLTKNDTDAMKATADFAKDSNVTVVGTNNVVNGDIYNQLKADKRIDGGADRFATNINVLKAFDSDLKADKLYVASATQANPDNLYADALVASAIAGKYAAPLVLTSTEGSTATDNAVSYIGTKATKATDLQVVGGTGVVSDATVSDIEDAVKDKDTDPEVSSITANGLNQIKVVFNQEVDEDTAKDVTNYKVDGSSLTDSNATAKLQDDNKTVLITLADKQKQNDDIDVTVKKAILTADKSKTVPEFTQTVTFSDTTAPTVDSVEVRGNNKLDIKFSEPVKGTLSQIVTKLKINNKNLSSFGLNTTGTDGNGEDLSKLDNSVGGYTDEVELYFDSSLPTGDNTLKISDAEENVLSDAAGFPVSDTTQDFTVDTLTTNPKVTSITAEDNGTVYVNFDRPMDSKTATQRTYYTINGGDAGNFTNAKLKKGDTQVKISGATLNKNSNTINISNKVKDTYGNKVADDTNESFTLDQDTTKPTVNSVSALNDNTIRVKFSKDVDASYAKSTSNYTLKDASGSDITSQIDSITIPGGSSSDTTGNVFDIKLSGSNKLSDSKYTITIKNIQDKATTPNVMDDYTTTFAGSADVNASASVYNLGQDADGKSKVVLVFNKEMDSSTLGSTSNYQYKNANGDIKNLPSGADITVSSDNKSVTIKLPTSLTTNTSTTDNDKLVKAIYATGVKDNDGNALSVGNNGGEFSTNDLSTGIKAKSLNLYYDGDDLKADVSFTNPIEDTTANQNVNNYSIAGDTNHPDTVSIDGSKVTLTFRSNDADDTSASTKINTIKAAGVNALLTVAGGITDVTGQALTGTLTTTPYSYDVAPKALNIANLPASINASSATVNVTFDTPIENSSVKPSDFVFSIGGNTINATSVSTNNTNTATFTFSGSDLNDFNNAVVKTGSSTIKVTPKTSSKISTIKDDAQKYAYYVPSSDDLKGMTATISTTSSAAPITTTVAKGSSAGTKVTAQGKLYYVLSDAAVTAPKFGDALPATSADYISGTDITTATAGKYLDLYAVDSNGKIVGFTEITLTTDNVK